MQLLSPKLRRWCLGVYWVAIFTATHWPDIDRYAPQNLPDYFDKIVHFCFYSGWFAVWSWVLAARGPASLSPTLLSDEPCTGEWRPLYRHHVVWLIVGGAAYGIFDELTQAIVERTPDVFDWLIDVAGLLAAALAVWAWQRYRARARAEQLV